MELARTQEFPRGSANRSYLLRVPVDAQGRIDGPSLERDPLAATVRRFWPSAPDLRGQVIRVGRDWAFAFHQGSGEPLVRHQPELGFASEDVMLVEPDGRVLRYGIADLRTWRTEAA